MVLLRLTCVAFILCSAVFAQTHTAQNGVIQNGVIWIPKNDLWFPLEKELRAIVDEFNLAHPKFPFQIQTVGTGFSTSQAVLAQKATGSHFDLALVDLHEMAGLKESLRLTPLPRSRIQALFADTHPLWALESIESVAFTRSAPLMIVNQEALFRNSLSPNHLPTQWIELEAMTKKVSPFEVDFLVRGAEGVAVFESLLGRDLAVSTKDALSTLRETLRPYGLRDFSQALERFRNQKSYLLVGRSELLPALRQGISFRWSVSKKGLFSKDAPSTGSQWLVANPANHEVWSLLRHLYQKKNAMRWAAAGGLIPLGKNTSAQWNELATQYGNYVEFLVGLAPKPQLEKTPQSLRFSSIREEMITEILVESR